MKTEEEEEEEGEEGRDDGGMKEEVRNSAVMLQIESFNDHHVR